MRRARRQTLTHWFAFVVGLSFFCLAAPAARSSAPAPKQSSSSSAHSSKASSKKKSKKRHAKREPSQKAPTPDRISEIQSALARNGYYHGDPNGKWDANTVAAMQKFQSDNGIDPSGKLNAPSLQRLGLGSSTAGVSAPKPAAPASSSPGPASTSPAPPSTPSASAAALSSMTAAAASATASTPSPSSSAPASKPPQP